MADTERKPITLAVATWEYLEELSRLGTHGTSVPDVAKTLIEDGIRQAIKDGFLKQRPPGRPPSQMSSTSAADLATPVRRSNSRKFSEGSDPAPHQGTGRMDPTD
jgi:hypothetical protein